MNWCRWHVLRPASWWPKRDPGCAQGAGAALRMRDNLLESARSRNDGAHVIGILRKAAIVALLLAAGNAWALGLGQIKVKSRINQPLLAEIPIISTTPGELAALRARLASPETFRRIGLPPPTGAAADLQFSLGSDARGRPVIRVTSVQPVDQAMVNFLIEVDWGAGKLVREYSALVDAPDTASAPVAQADVQMAAVEAPNIVQRPALPEAAADPVTAEPLPPQPEVGAPAAPTPIAAEPPVPETAVDVSTPSMAAEAPASSAAVAAPTTAEAAVAAADDAGQYGPIKRGETLSAIASSLGLRNTFSLDQTMLALLRANPDAFISDNINRLRQGAVLRVPESGEVAQIDAGEAGAVVRQQMQAWRQSQRPVLQPDAVAMEGTAPANRAPAAPTVAPSAAAARTTAASGARRTEARLQIVPPAGTTPAAGANTGTGNRGGGSMLQQELAQRDEEISAKTAEIGDLKERVAELERIRDEQNRLLNMKDTELASAQHRLAETNQAAVPAAATGAEQTPVAPPSNNNLYYIGGGVGVLLLGLLVWFLSKRNQPEPENKPRRSFDHDALAASMQRLDRQRGQKPKSDPAPTTETPAVSPEPPPAANPRGETPAWHSGWVVKGAASRPEASSQDAASTAAPEAAQAAAPAAAVAAGSEPPARASADQRFKLVDAFLDMGDRTSAQQLLAELLNDEDDAVSEKAGKMLARIMG